MKYHHLICITLTSLIMLAGCTTSSSEDSTVVPPPVPSPLVLTDIVFAPSGGATSRYTEATVTIEGSTIVISNIANYSDTTRTETLRISIADGDDPVAYTVNPEFIDIAANELNPDGTDAVTNTLADREFTLTPVNGDAAITYTVSLRFSEMPPISSPLALTDIVLTPSGGATSRYTEATVAIEEDLIIISNIANHFDTTRTETFRISIADADDPAAYTVNPEFIDIAANELNPDGTAAVTTTLANRTFTLTPANGDAAIIYAVSLRLSELEVVMLTPLSVEDITIDTASHPAYAKASVLSVSDNIISIGGIKNRVDGFNEALTLTVTDKINPPTYTIAGGNIVTLPGTEINPAGTAAITTATNEALTFTVTPTADNALPVKYYIILVLGDLIQLELLGGTDGDLMTALTLTEEIAPTTDTLVLKNCGVFPPPYRVLVGGTDMTAAYTLTATGINSYISNTYTGDLTLTGGTTTLTFSSLSVTTSTCTASADLLGSGMNANDPYIIDNDRKLNLVATLVNGSSTYRGRYYRVTRDIDLARPMAPWSAGNGFTPIGNGGQIVMNMPSVVFNGTFDCQGNVISNLYISANSPYKGLFGVVGMTMRGTAGTITNCGLVNANVKVSGFSASYVGSLVGQLNSSGTIAKSYSEQATVTITGTSTIATYLGGLVGYSDGTISDSYSTGTVSNSGAAAGGLAGQNAGAISRSYSRVTVSGHNRIGGLVGMTSVRIENSYATGNVTATDRSAGGLAGDGSSHFTNSYAIGEVTGTGTGINGLIGSTFNVMITNSYWDTVTSGQTGGNGAAVGRTTTQLQVAAPVPDGDDAVYVNWDTAIWNFRAGAYPRLKTVACANRQYTTTTSACEDIP